MRRIIYISHAQVAVDPNVPVPEWSLSAEGQERHRVFSSSTLARSVTHVYSSTETKAIEAANAMFGDRHTPIVLQPDMHENDRSSTGFLPPERFQAVADQFFAHPEHAILGWERAKDAQNRIVAAINQVVAAAPDAAILACSGHGGVGTLLYCHHAQRPISRQYDQPAYGGGNVIIIDLTANHHVISITEWAPMEAYL